MKKKSLLIAMCITCLFVHAQILHPVKWAYAAKRTGENETTIMIKATIEKGWHTYSVNQPDGGPIKTSFTFTFGNDYELVGKVMEPKPLTEFNKVFNMKVSYFANSVVFMQKIKLNAQTATVKGAIHFMVCNDQKCLPPDDVDFSIPVK